MYWGPLLSCTDQARISAAKCWKTTATWLDGPYLGLGGAKPLPCGGRGAPCVWIPVPSPEPPASPLVGLGAAAGAAAVGNEPNGPQLPLRGEDAGREASVCPEQTQQDVPHPQTKATALRCARPLSFSAGPPDTGAVHTPWRGLQATGRCFRGTPGSGPPTDAPSTAAASRPRLPSRVV